MGLVVRGCRTWEVELEPSLLIRGLGREGLWEVRVRLVRGVVVWDESDGLEVVRRHR